MTHFLVHTCHSVGKHSSRLKNYSPILPDRESVWIRSESNFEKIGKKRGNRIDVSEFCVHNVLGGQCGMPSKLRIMIRKPEQHWTVRRREWTDFTTDWGLLSVPYINLSKTLWCLSNHKVGTYRKSPNSTVFWGKENTVLCEIRTVRGLF